MTMPDPYVGMQLDHACRAKWEAGAKVYGPVFVGNPAAHLFEECVDALNYIDEMARQRYPSGRLDELRRAVRKVALEAQLLYWSREGNRNAATASA